MIYLHRYPISNILSNVLNFFKKNQILVRTIYNYSDKI